MLSGGAAIVRPGFITGAAFAAIKGIQQMNRCSGAQSRAPHACSVERLRLPDEGHWPSAGPTSAARDAVAVGATLLASQPRIPGRGHRHCLGESLRAPLRGPAGAVRGLESGDLPGEPQAQPPGGPLPSNAGFSNRVCSPMKLRWTVPQGPLRCLPMITSESRSISLRFCSSVTYRASR